MSKNKITSVGKLWWVIAISGLIGLLASFIQTIERINYADDKLAVLSCDINSVIGCSNVFDAWQSSVFGFSNSLMCMVFFGFLLAIGLAAATGSVINKYYRLAINFFSLFFLGFGAWYLHQSAFDVGTICVFCIFCYASVILANWAQLRLNYNDWPMSKKYKNLTTKCIKHGADSFFWILWALVVTALLIIGVR